MPKKRERTIGSPKELSSLVGLHPLTIARLARRRVVQAERVTPGGPWSVVAQRSALTGAWRLVPRRVRS